MSAITPSPLARPADPAKSLSLSENQLTVAANALNPSKPNSDLNRGASRARDATAPIRAEDFVSTVSDANVRAATIQGRQMPEFGTRALPLFQSQ